MAGAGPGNSSARGCGCTAFCCAPTTLPAAVAARHLITIAAKGAAVGRAGGFDSTGVLRSMDDTTSARKELARLRKEVRELKTERDILKSGRSRAPRAGRPSGRPARASGPLALVSPTRARPSRSGPCRGRRRSLSCPHRGPGGPHGVELIGELAPRSAFRGVGHRSGHRIPHTEDVHQTGSMPSWHHIDCVT